MRAAQNLFGDPHKDLLDALDSYQRKTDMDQITALHDAEKTLLLVSGLTEYDAVVQCTLAIVRAAIAKASPSP